MQEAGLETIETYIFLHQNKISQYIETHHILELCPAAEWHPGHRYQISGGNRVACAGRASEAVGMKTEEAGEDGVEEDHDNSGRG